MNSIKRDELKTIEAQIQELTGDNSAIKIKFEVVPVDYRVIDMSSPTLYLHAGKLIFVYDDILEFYELNELNIDILGDNPSFEIYRLMFEPQLLYDEMNLSTVAKIRDSEHMTKLSINENQKVPKEFVMRQQNIVQKNYKTWAMSQIIINYKNKITPDDRLQDILAGNFLNFNQKTVLIFIAIFIAYFVLKIIIGDLLPGIIQAILDGLFVIVLILMSVWTYLSVQRNLEIHKVTYKSYSDQSPKVVNSI